MEQAHAAAAFASRPRSWPPTAERHGAEPTFAAILLMLVGATWITHALGWLVPHEADPDVARWLVDGLRLALWLGIVAALAWWRPAGFGLGGASPWGLVPLAVLAVAVPLSGWPGYVPNGTGFAIALAGSDAMGALREEVVFRGILFHGLARRLGGALAVVVGSGLFALSHVPRYLREERPGAEVVGLLIVIFCVGVFLCRVRAASGSIWLPAAIHTTWNVAVGVGGIAPPGGGLSGGLTLLYAGPFAIGMVLFVALALPRVWPRAFGSVGAFEILGTPTSSRRATS